MKGLGFFPPLSGIIRWLGIDSRTGIWVLFGESFHSLGGGNSSGWKGETWLEEVKGGGLLQRPEVLWFV